MDQNQLADYYAAMFPGQIRQSMAGGAPAGANKTAGVVNGVSQMALAMLQNKRMKDYQQKYGQARGGQPLSVPGTPSGQTLSTPGGLGGAMPTADLA